MPSKNITRICLAVMVSIPLVLSATACNTNRQADNAGNTDNSGTANKANNGNGAAQYKTQNEKQNGAKQNNTAKQNADRDQRANTEHLYSTVPIARSALPKQISDRVSHIAGVDKATVLVSNRDILVGVDAKKGEDPGIVEEHVRHRLTLDQPRYRVHVTSDKKMHERIRKLNTQVNGGHPVQNFTNDVGAIITDIGKTMTAPFKK